MKFVYFLVYLELRHCFVGFQSLDYRENFRAGSNPQQQLPKLPVGPAQVVIMPGRPAKGCARAGVWGAEFELSGDSKEF